MNARLADQYRWAVVARPVHSVRVGYRAAIRVIPTNQRRSIAPAKHPVTYDNPVFIDGLR